MKLRGGDRSRTKWGRTSRGAFSYGNGQNHGGVSSSGPTIGEATANIRNRTAPTGRAGKVMDKYRSAARERLSAMGIRHG